MRSSVNQRLNGKSVAQYNSISTASRLTGADGSNISKVTGGARRTAGGFGWETAENVNTRRKIVAVDPSTYEVVAVFNDLDTVRTTTNARMDRVVSTIAGNRRTAHGLVWAITG